jgi:hypothetical protein
VESFPFLDLKLSLHAPSLPCAAASYAGELNLQTTIHIIFFCFFKSSGVPDIGIFRVVDDHARVLCLLLLLLLLCRPHPLHILLELYSFQRMLTQAVRVRVLRYFPFV